MPERHLEAALLGLDAARRARTALDRERRRREEDDDLAQPGPALGRPVLRGGAAEQRGAGEEDGEE